MVQYNPQNVYGSGVNNMGNLTVADMVPQEMLYLVDTYWFQYPPMNPLWHSLLGFALTIFSIIAFLGNLCVIYVFTKTRSLRTPSNLLVVNLAVSDFMIMFTMGPPMIVNCYYETWVFGPLACQIVSIFIQNLLYPLEINQFLFINSTECVDHSLDAFQSGQ